MAQDSRRTRITAGISTETGIDEEMIRQLVHGFYDRVREDSILGPVFNARIDDWSAHLARMCDFWSSVALLTGRYHGQPMVKHAFLPVDFRHFDRWLHLFEETARTVCTEKAAALFLDRARRIAESFELGIAMRHDVLLAKGERFVNERLDVPA